MPPQPKKVEIPNINPSITINGITLNSAIATVQIDALGAHGHTVPLGGLGAAYVPASLGVNQFVYLGT
jgi:hypothetical protein